jgi:hypothetical protein
MRKDLVLNDDEKKVRFKRLLQRRQEGKSYSDDIQKMPALEPINKSIAQIPQFYDQYLTEPTIQPFRNKSPKTESSLYYLNKNVLYDRTEKENKHKQEEQELMSACYLQVQKADLKNLFDENMALRLSGLSFLMNEAYSGNFQTLRSKILLNSESYLSSISQTAISNYLKGDTIGSLTFTNGIPEIPELDKQIIENLQKIQYCASKKMTGTFEKTVTVDENTTVREVKLLRKINKKIQRK